MQHKLLINFARIGDPKFLAKAKEIITALHAEPALTRLPEPWPAAFPSWAQLETALTEYKAAYFDAVDGSKTARDIRNAKRQVLMDLFKKLAPYLEAVAVAADDVTILGITGYDRRRPIVRSTLNGTLPAPTLRVERGLLEGTLVVRAARLSGAGSYEGQAATGDRSVEGNYKTMVISRRATHIEFTGLTPGQVYHLRLRGIGSRGPGAWSNVVSLMAT